MRGILKISIVFTVALLVLAIATTVVVPRLIAGQIATDARRKTGLDLSYEGSPHVSFAGGFEIVFLDATLAHRGTAEVPVVAAKRAVIPLSFAQVFSGKLVVEAVQLEDPIFNFVLDEDSESAANGGVKADVPVKSAKPLIVTLRNGVIKLSDHKRGVAVTAADISGRLARDSNGQLEVSARGLLNNKPTTLVATVDDVRRVKTDGSPADITLDSGENRISFSGRLRARSAVALDGSLAADTPDVRAFAAWLGLPLKGFETSTALSLDSGLSISGTHVELPTLAFTLGAMHGKGKLSLTSQTLRPRFDATLDLDRLDVNAYRRKASDTSSVPNIPSLTDDWNERPLDFSDLRALDGKILISTKALQMGALKTGTATADVTFENGQLSAILNGADVNGGRAQATVSLSQTADAPILDVDLSVVGAEAKEFLSRSVGLKFLSGPVDIEAQLQAEGNSEARLVSSLKGTITAAMENGRIDGVDLAKRAGFFGNGDADGWGLDANEATIISRATIRLQIDEGIARLDNAELEAAGVTSSIDGEIDILRRALDLSATPKVKLAEEPDIKIPVRIAIKGAWENPRFSADFDAPEEIEDAAKKVGKKAKKALKKLFGN